MKQKMGVERNIRKKFIVATIIPVMLLLAAFTCFMWVSFRVMLKWKTEEAVKVLTQKVQQMDEMYRNNCRRAADSQDVLTYLKTGEKRNKVFEEYYQSVLGEEIRFQMVLVDMDRNICLRTNTRDGYQLDYSLLPIVKLSNERSREEVRIFSRVKEDELIYYYGYGTVVYDGRNPAGYVIYYVSSSNLADLFAESRVEEAAITNLFDTVIAATSETSRNSYNKLVYAGNESGNIECDGRRYYMSVHSLEEEGFKIYAIESRTYEKYFLQIVPPFLAVVLISLFVLLFALSKDISHRITKPIEVLLAAVQKTSQGQFDGNVELHTGDEFEVLASEYNRMVKEIDCLIDKNNHTAELQRIAEFKTIRNQLNPHFIFNVLETLRYMIFSDVKEAERIILILSKFLRYNIYNQDKFVPLREDMEHMEDFFALHKARFQERMTYEIHMEENAGNVFVPKFFIQPFAENSIKYGFQNRTRFDIKVNIWMKGKQLKVTVTDNGGGMTNERYREVMEHLSSDQYPDDHVGLYNINKMLKLIYGSEYGLTLVNKEGEGLEVQVIIPVREL